MILQRRSRVTKELELSSSDFDPFFESTADSVLKESDVLDLPVELVEFVELRPVGETQKGWSRKEDVRTRNGLRRAQIREVLNEPEADSEKPSSMLKVLPNDPIRSLRLTATDEEGGRSMDEMDAVKEGEIVFARSSFRRGRNELL